MLNTPLITRNLCIIAIALMFLLQVVGARAHAEKSELDLLIKNLTTEEQAIEQKLQVEDDNPLKQRDVLSSYLDDNYQDTKSTDNKSDLVGDNLQNLSTSIAKDSRPVIRSLIRDQELQKAYQLLRGGKRAKFSRALNKITLNSKDPISNAQSHYWIGMVLLDDGDHRKAAQSFLDGYKSGSQNLFTAYNLWGLAQTMKGLKKQEEACATADKLDTMIREEEDFVYPSMLSQKVQSFIASTCRR